jgi:hypothetical protein
MTSVCVQCCCVARERCLLPMSFMSAHALTRRCRFASVDSVATGAHFPVGDEAGMGFQGSGYLLAGLSLHL